MLLNWSVVGQCEMQWFFALNAPIDYMLLFFQETASKEVATVYIQCAVNVCVSVWVCRTLGGHMVTPSALHMLRRAGVGWVGVRG